MTLLVKQSLKQILLNLMLNPKHGPSYNKSAPQFKIAQDFRQFSKSLPHTPDKPRRLLSHATFSGNLYRKPKGFFPFIKMVRTKMWSSHKPKLSKFRPKMGTPSSLPTNPNPSPSPPLPQSPPPRTPPLPQSPPPPSPLPPPSQIPPLIPPTPLSPQTEPQNETPILDTHSPEPVPEPAPTQTKTKGKTKRAVGRPKETPIGK
ncbi:vegetative cell wall protein gp1-like [Hevea brasiliensis]|uniref:vegetative cell wall protein gp1-like n=1 Tax=Hevea brasiliensis TaxID=3981 RepID=UPI0025E42786|nr:vegetative cell wall protein gp1-like [Hevea brasiliensis]